MSKQERIKFLFNNGICSKTKHVNYNLFGWKVEEEIEVLFSKNMELIGEEKRIMELEIENSSTIFIRMYSAHHQLEQLHFFIKIL